MLAVALMLVIAEPQHKVWQCTNVETGTPFVLTYDQTGTKIRNFEVLVSGAPASYQRWKAKLEPKRIWVEGPLGTGQFRWLELLLTGDPAKPNLNFGTTFGGSLVDDANAACREGT